MQQALQKTNSLSEQQKTRNSLQKHASGLISLRPIGVADLFSPRALSTISTRLRATLLLFDIGIIGSTGDINVFGHLTDLQFSA